MVNDAFDYDLDVEATQQIEVAEDRLYKLAEIGQTEGGLSPFRMAVLESLHLTEAAMKQDGLSGVSTGLTDLDKLLGGLHRSDLLLLAARPSMGQTALPTNIAFNVAASTRAEKDAEVNPIEPPPPAALLPPRQP